MYSDSQQAKYNEYQALREKYKPYLVDYVESHLQKARAKGYYICPLCGKSKFTLSKNYKDTWTCYYSGHDIQNMKNQNGYSGDIFELVGAMNSLDTKRDFVKIIEILGQEFGDVAEPTHRQEIQQEKKPPRDQTGFYKKWAAALPDFVAGKEYRGLSMETLKHFCIGYNDYEGGCIILPADRFNYGRRWLNRDVRYTVYGEKIPFNQKAFFSDVLTSDVSGLIVEGEFDCMSVYEIDSHIPCIASRSGGEPHIVNTLRELKEKGQTPKRPLIICMDKDDAGEGHTEYLKQGLRELGISFYVYEWENVPYKDFNEFLQADRDRFRMTVYSLATKYTEPPAKKQEETEKMETPAEKNGGGGFLKYQASETAARLWEDIENDRKKTVYPTGIKQLDKILGGGLFEGLYVVGADPGIGKTSFCLQIADNIAETQPVLFFTYEMTADQLTAKSLCRLCCGIDNGFRASSLSLQGYGEPPTSKDKETIQKAVAEFYKGIGQNLYIIEAEAKTTADIIGQEVKRFKAETGRRPVVVVDYLQIIPGDPTKAQQESRGRVSEAVEKLTQLFREEHIPVILISAWSRNSTSKNTMGAYRDSSTIEYNATVCIGLENKTEDTKDGKKTLIDHEGRHILLSILKNKQVPSPKDPIHLVFNGTAQTFTESKSNEIPGTLQRGQTAKDVQNLFDNGHPKTIRRK